MKLHATVSQTFSPDTPHSKAKKQRKINKLEPRKRCRLDNTDVIESPSAAADCDVKIGLPNASSGPTSDLDPSSDYELSEVIRNHLVRKNERTLCVSGLPADVTVAKLHDLAPDVHVVKLAWSSLFHKCTGSALLEFESTELVHHYQKKFDGLKYRNKILSARTGTFLPEDAGRYDWTRLVLYGLHHKTRVAEIARRFPKALSIVVPLSARKRVSSAVPIRAFLTFPSAHDALSAYDARLGCVIRKRKIGMSWFIKKDAPQKAPRTCLLARGLKKSTTEKDLQVVFPQAASIVLRLQTGEALLHYDMEEDCLLDKDNSRNLRLFGRPLQVMFYLPNRDKSKITNSKVSRHVCAVNLGDAPNDLNLTQKKKRAKIALTQRPKHYKAKHSILQVDPKSAAYDRATDNGPFDGGQLHASSLPQEKPTNSGTEHKLNMKELKKLKARRRNRRAHAQKAALKPAT